VKHSASFDGQLILSLALRMSKNYYKLTKGWDV